MSLNLPFVNSNKRKIEKEKRRRRKTEDGERRKKKEKGEKKKWRSEEEKNKQFTLLWSIMYMVQYPLLVGCGAMRQRPSRCNGVKNSAKPGGTPRITSQLYPSSGSRSANASVGSSSSRISLPSARASVSATLSATWNSTRYLQMYNWKFCHILKRRNHKIHDD